LLLLLLLLLLGFSLYVVSAHLYCFSFIRRSRSNERVHVR
jgi:hypothetical protein